MAAQRSGMRGPRGHLTEEEKKNKPKISKNLLARIFSYLKPYIPQFLLGLIMIIISAVIGLAPSIITGRIVDDALTNGNMRLLVILLVLAFVTLSASRLISVAECYINAWISQRIVFDLRNQMYDHLQHMPHAFFTNEKQGEIFTRMDNDISDVSIVISRTLSSIARNIIIVMTTLVALFSLNWQLALVSIVIVPVLILPTKLVGKKRWALIRKSHKYTDDMNQLINETLSVSGSLLVKLFTREKEEYNRFKSINEKLSMVNIKEERSNSWFRVAIGIFSELGPLLIYFVGGMLIVLGAGTGTAVSIGTITAVVALVNRLYRPVEDLTNISVEFTRSLALFSRIFDYFDRTATIRSPENGKKPDFSVNPVAFKHVSFSYSSEKPLLNDINFTVPPGKMYAVVGPSGSGKSTIVNLIPRLYDVTDGSISIGEDDVRQIDLEYLRNQIGLVSQETYLFNGTIIDNLKYAKSDATQEEIENACKIANIHDFIVNQPDGYLTMVGNRGLKLSGGEKQRVSIARVMLKDPKILILDEATSSLDSISENAIQDALDNIMKTRTSIVIAHRLTTILKADKILVVSDGKIAEEGTHEELLSQNGIYRELYETQFRKVIDMENSGE